VAEFEAFLTGQYGFGRVRWNVLDNEYLDLLLLIVIVLVDGHTLLLYGRGDLD
jgi:hypothetical protein